METKKRIDEKQHKNNYRLQSGEVTRTVTRIWVRGDKGYGVTSNRTIINKQIDNVIFIHSLINTDITGLAQVVWSNGGRGKGRGTEEQGEDEKERDVQSSESVHNYIFSYWSMRRFVFPPRICLQTDNNWN